MCVVVVLFWDLVCVFCLWVCLSLFCGVVLVVCLSVFVACLGSFVFVVLFVVCCDVLYCACLAYGCLGCVCCFVCGVLCSYVV